jgi:hypothetical protein
MRIRTSWIVFLLLVRILPGLAEAQQTSTVSGTLTSGSANESVSNALVIPSPPRSPGRSERRRTASFR